MAALLDLHQRILSVYDRGEGPRAMIALRFDVSLGMVKKLLQQRRHKGHIRPRHDRAGRKKPLLLSIIMSSVSTSPAKDGTKQGRFTADVIQKQKAKSESD